MILKDREVKEFWILRESYFIAERKGKRELLGAQIIARNIRNNDRDLRAEISFEFLSESNLLQEEKRAEEYWE